MTVVFVTEGRSTDPGEGFGAVESPDGETGWNLDSALEARGSCLTRMLH